MKFLWHLPTFRRQGCGLSLRARRLADGLRDAGGVVQFAVPGHRADDFEGALDGHVVLPLEVAVRRPFHWSIQALARRGHARRAAEALSCEHDLFLTCQPEMISAYRRRFGARPAVFVCASSSVLNEPSEREQFRRAPMRVRAALALDRRLRRANERLALDNADLVIFDSHHTRECMLRELGGRAERCHTVHGGVDAMAFRPATDAERSAARLAAGLLEDEFAITWTGRLSPEKDLHLLLRSFAVARMGGAKLLIVGDGPLRRELEQFSITLGIADRTIFTGMQQDVRPFLHAADAFAFTSSGESFGSSLVEAMACGLPCIVTRPSGGVRNATNEVVGDEACACIADAAPQSIAREMERLAERPGLRRSMGALARERAARLFTWSAAARQFVALVAEIARTTSAPSMNRGSTTAERRAPWAFSRAT